MNLVLLFLFVLSASGEYCDTLECHERLYGQTTVKSGGEVVLFVHLLNSASVEDKRDIYYPYVDMPSILVVNGSGCLYEKDSNVEIVVEVNGVKSDPVKFFDDDYYISLYTVIVYAKDGVVQSISFDTVKDCRGCSTSHCINDICASEIGTPDDCSLSNRQINLFVTWVGTDIDGTQLTSVQYIPSRLIDFGIGDALIIAKDITSIAQDIANNN